MSVDLGFSSSAPSTPSRYPHRKRKAICYAEPQDDEAMVLEPEPKLDDEEELEPAWGSRKKPKKSPPKMKAVPARKTFPFMSLPPELRNKIYEFALIAPHGIHIRSVQGKFRRQAAHCTPQGCMAAAGFQRFYQQEWLQRDGNIPEEPPMNYKPGLVPALLATCKKINAEAKAILYSQPFFVSDTSALQAFLLRLGPPTMGLLRDLTIISWCKSRSAKAVNLPAMAMLRDASNLERLHIFETVGHSGFIVPHNPDNDAEGAKQVAHRVYRDSFPWLETVARRGDPQALRKILVVSEMNFTRSRDVHWPKERLAKSEGLMFDEILRLLETGA